MSHTQTAIDSKVDSLIVLLFVVDLVFVKSVFNYYKLSGRPKSFSSNDRSRLVSYDCIIHMVDPSHAETLTHCKSSELDLVTQGLSSSSDCISNIGLSTTSVATKLTKQFCCKSDVRQGVSTSSDFISNIA
jgi:hypothetical protein